MQAEDRIQDRAAGVPPPGTTGRSRSFSAGGAAKSLRRSIERLGPYPSLFLLALPTATVEPLKLVAVAVAGKGHWITGTAMIVACYAFSLLVLERLFAIVKPKLLTISWFAKLWGSFIAAKTRLLHVFSGWIGLRDDRSAWPEQVDRAAVIDPPSTSK